MSYVVHFEGLVALAPRSTYVSASVSLASLWLARETAQSNIQVAHLCNHISSGLPQIQDFEIPDFFKTFSGQEIIFFKTANDRNFIRAYQKI